MSLSSLYTPWGFGGGDIPLTQGSIKVQPATLELRLRPSCTVTQRVAGVVCPVRPGPASSMKCVPGLPRAHQGQACTRDGTQQALGTWQALLAGPSLSSYRHAEVSSATRARPCPAPGPATMLFHLDGESCLHAGPHASPTPMAVPALLRPSRACPSDLTATLPLTGSHPDAP